jgi:hypothetical protein
VPGLCFRVRFNSVVVLLWSLFSLHEHGNHPHCPSRPSMALKWFKSIQKSKKLIPNVYLTPDDTNLIVTPEFDAPLSFPFSTTLERPHSSPPSYDQNIDVNHTPVSSETTSYHYVLARTLSNSPHRHDTHPNRNNSLYNTASNPTHHKKKLSTETSPLRTGTKLRKPPPSSRALSTRSVNTATHSDLYHPRVDPPIPDVIQNSSGNNTIPPSAFLDAHFDAAIRSHFSPSPSSPSVSTQTPSVGSQSPLLHSRQPSTSRRNTKKLIKRKPQPSTPSLDYARLDSTSSNLTLGISLSAHHCASQSSLNTVRAQSPPPAAVHARFPNASVPDLPTHARHSHQRYATSQAVVSPPDLRGRSPQISDRSARKPVPFPSLRSQHDTLQTSDRAVDRKTADLDQGASQSAAYQAEKIQEENGVTVHMVSLWLFAMFRWLLSRSSTQDLQTQSNSRLFPFTRSLHMKESPNNVHKTP